MSREEKDYQLFVNKERRAPIREKPSPSE